MYLLGIVYLYSVNCRCIFLFYLIPLFGLSQTSYTSEDSAEADLNILYRKEHYTQGLIHTRGYGIALGYGQHKTARIKQIQEFRFNVWKHPKTTTSVSNSNSDRPSFEYGKLVSLYEFSYLYGYRTTLFRKSDRKAIECRQQLLAGPTIFAAKPYYIEIEKQLNNQEYVVYSSRFNENDFDKDSLSVYGRAPFLTGINQITWFPCITLKYGLSFEYANSFQRIRALEIGLQYTRIIPTGVNNSLQMMYSYPAESGFFNFYLSLHVGYKHNRP